MPNIIDHKRHSAKTSSILSSSAFRNALTELTGIVTPLNVKTSVFPFSGVVTGILMSLFSLMAASANESLTFHSANTDPLSEGWSLSREGATVGPVNDPESLYPLSWSIDTTLTAGGFAHYSVAPNAQEILWSKIFGWNLGLAVDVQAVGNNQSVFAYFSDGTSRYKMIFGRREDGTGTVSLDEGKTYYNSPDEYGRYDLIYTPDRGGVLCYTGGGFLGVCAGVPSSERVAMWGVGPEHDGNANFSLVRFAIVPEPSGAILLILAASIFLGGVAGQTSGRRK